MRQLIVSRLEKIARDIDNDEHGLDNDELVRVFEGVEDLEELIDYIQSSEPDDE